MSVRTTWDERKDKLEEDLKSAKSNLVVLVDSQTWGYDDISLQHIEELEQMFIEICRMIKKL